MGAANESWNVSPSGDGLKNNFIFNSSGLSSAV